MVGPRDGVDDEPSVASAGELVSAVACGRTRHLETFAAGRNQRLCAFVATPGASGSAADHAMLVESTLTCLLSNTGDRADALDAAVRARETPVGGRFTRARVPALLRGANAQLRESQVRAGVRDMPAISAAVLTTQFGRATVANVGDGVAVHRLRCGQVERLTPTVQRIAPGISVPRPQDLLGWTDSPDVHERDDLLERGDTFVMCEWFRGAEPNELLAELACAPSFERALYVCFARLGPGSVLLAHWP
jgi:hypothetical protein